MLSFIVNVPSNDYSFRWSFQWKLEFFEPENKLSVRKIDDGTNGQFCLAVWNHRTVQEEELPKGMNTARIDSCYELRAGFNKLYRPEAGDQFPLGPIKRHRKSGVLSKENSTKQITCLPRNWDEEHHSLLTREGRNKKKGPATECAGKRGRIEMQDRRVWSMICSVCLIGPRKDLWELKTAKESLSEK